MPIKDYSGLAALCNLGKRYAERGVSVTVLTAEALNGRIFATFGKRLTDVEVEWADACVGDLEGAGGKDA